MPSVSVLVAFREDSKGLRGRLWDFVRHRLETELPDAEVIVATNDAMPFNKCAALNQAAAAAAGDVFFITDTDTWCNPSDVLAGVELVRSGAPWVKPWVYKTKLNREDTEAVLALGDAWDGVVTAQQRRRAEYRTRWWSSPPQIVPRAAFETVNGLDERIAGWGQDDDAFGAALECLVGHRVEIGTDCVHLWHPRIGQSGRDAWEGSEMNQNIRIGQAYGRARRDPDRMRELVAGNRPAS